jgi:outer membrane protein
MKINYLLSLSLMFGGLISQTTQAQNLITLYQSAQTYDSSFQASQAQFEAAQNRVTQARAGLLPSANLSAGVTRARTETETLNQTTTFSNTGQTAGINATQPLYRPANSLAFTQSEKLLAVAQSQLEVAEQDLMLRVSQAYFNVLAAQDTLGFVQAQKKAVAEQLTSAKRNFEVGTTTITDTHEAQARYDLVIAQEIAADNDLQVKRMALDQLVGASHTQPVPLALPIVPPAIAQQSLEEWVNLTYLQQPSIAQATIAFEIAQLETQKAEAGHRPTLDLNAGYNINRNPNGVAAQNSAKSRIETSSIGLSFNMPLFAGFAIQSRVKETLALEEKARADLETAKRVSAQNTRSAYFNVVSTQGQVKALEAAQASSQSALDANLLGYQVGIRINMDVLNAQSQLFQTQRDLAQARYNLLLGNLALRQASGQLELQDLRTRLRSPK